MPTFLEVANLQKPTAMRIDGVSLLPVLLHIDPTHGYKHHKRHKVNQTTLGLKSSQHLNTNTFGSSSLYAYNKYHTQEVSPDFSKMFEHIDNRLHLWHKETDPYQGTHERMHSAAYYKDIKIITSSYRGCLVKIYDMKHDQYESHNLYNGGGSGWETDCKINFDAQNIHTHILRDDLIRNHCEKRTKKNSHSSSTTTGKTGTGAAAAEYQSHGHCLSKYVHSVIEKVQYMLPHLARFAKYGSGPFHSYMKNDEKNAVCIVPSISQIKPIEFEIEPGCWRKGTCSVPMH